MTRNSDGSINWKFAGGVMLGIIGFLLSTATTLLLGKLNEMTHDINRLTVAVARIAQVLKIPVDSRADAKALMDLANSKMPAGG